MTRSVLHFGTSFRACDLSTYQAYERRLSEIRQKLADVPLSHVWPFQRWVDTDKAAYLVRQYFYSNLYDRISTRPFLTAIEKKWLAFQLLHAVSCVCFDGSQVENPLLWQQGRFDFVMKVCGWQRPNLRRRDLFNGSHGDVPQGRT